MKSLTKYVLLTLVLAFGASTAANAKTDRWWSPPTWDRKPLKSDPTPVAPEVDPSLAIGGISLLAGGLTILRARKGK